MPAVLPSVNASLKPVRDFCETGCEGHMHRSRASSGSTTGWAIGYTIGIVVVLVVVALVVPILVLAHKIGTEAGQDINDSLQLVGAQHGGARRAATRPSTTREVIWPG